jgi:hypothetical protein
MVPSIVVKEAPRASWLLPVTVVGLFSIIAGMFALMASFILAPKPVEVRTTIDAEAIAEEIGPYLDTPLSTVEDCGASLPSWRWRRGLWRRRRPSVIDGQRRGALRLHHRQACAELRRHR